MANFLFFGDSITEGFWDSEGGWVERIRRNVFQNTINSQFSVFHRFYNLGVSGNNTEGLVSRFENEVKARLEGEDKKENIITIAIGINDSQVYQATHTTRVPFEKFKENLTNIFRTSHSFADTVFSIGLTAVDESKVNPSPWTPEKSYMNASIQKFNDALREISLFENVTFIPVLEEWLQQPYQDLLSDGLHPNTEGHEKLFNNIYPHLESFLKKP